MFVPVDAAEISVCMNYWSLELNRYYKLKSIGSHFIHPQLVFFANGWRIYKVGGANFVFPYICSFLHYLHHVMMSVILKLDANR